MAGNQTPKPSDPSGQPTDDGDAQSRDLLAIYARMLTWSFCSTLAILFVLFLMLVLPNLFFSGTTQSNDGSDRSSVFIVVMMCGGLGAFFSSLIRLYSYEDLPKALIVDHLQQLKNTHIVIYSLVPPVIGGISAAALYIAFAAGIVGDGGLFPEFSCKFLEGTGENCSKFIEFIDHFGPNSAADHAKVLIWGFIAGFAERLVPDTLRGLANRQTKEE